VHVENRKSLEVKKVIFKIFFAESRGNALGEEFFTESFLASFVLHREFFLLSAKSSSPRAQGVALANDFTLDQGSVSYSDYSFYEIFFQMLVLYYLCDGGMYLKTEPFPDGNEIKREGRHPSIRPELAVHRAAMHILHLACLLQPWCPPRSLPTGSRAPSRPAGSGHVNIAPTSHL
jgi:hypothetical protein